MSFDDTVLLSIRRSYSKEESFKLILDELSKAKFKIGELLSENAELKDKLEESSKLSRQKKPEPSKLNAALIWIKPKLTKDDMKEGRFIELNKKLSTQGATIKKLKEDLNIWRTRFLNLAAKCDKDERSVATML